MNKNLITEGQAYLHLYLGCDVMVTPPEASSYKCRLTGVMTERTDGENKLRLQVFEDDGPDGYEGHGIKWFDDDEVELMLRPLASMTETEKHALFKYIWPNDHAATPLGQEYCINYALDIGDEGSQIDNWMEDAAATINSPIQWTQITLWLASRGFDLLGLIHRGLAIEAPIQ